MTKKERRIKLEVIESLQEDIDKGIARMPSQIMESLKFNSGDLIEVTGKKSVVLKLMRAHTEDTNKK